MPMKAKTGYTPVTDPMACEVCGTVVTLANTHSVSVCYNMPGAGYAAYQCANEQHFACSHEHAYLAAMACLLSHIENGTHAQPLSAPGTYVDSDLQTIQNIIAKYES